MAGELFECRAKLESLSAKSKVDESNVCSEKAMIAALQTEKSNLLELVENMKSDKYEIERSHEAQIDEEKNKNKLAEQKIGELETSLKFEKDFIAQLE